MPALLGEARRLHPYVPASPPPLLPNCRWKLQASLAEAVTEQERVKR